MNSKNLFKYGLVLLHMVLIKDKVTFIKRVTFNYKCFCWLDQPQPVSWYRKLITRDACDNCNMYGQFGEGHDGHVSCSIEKTFMGEKSCDSIYF